MAFEKGVEGEAINNGLAVIKQVGETIVVNNENLKVF
jgi:hypothetical protein